MEVSTITIPSNTWSLIVSTQIRKWCWHRHFYGDNHFGLLGRTKIKNTNHPYRHPHKTPWKQTQPILFSGSLSRETASKQNSALDEALPTKTLFPLRSPQINCHKKKKKNNNNNSDKALNVFTISYRLLILYLFTAQLKESLLKMSKLFCTVCSVIALT